MLLLGLHFVMELLISLTAGEADTFWSSSSVTLDFLLWNLCISVDMNPLSTKS